MDWKFLLGLLGPSAVWAWSVFTWYKSQAAQRNQSDYVRKEALYRALLRSLSVFYKGSPSTDTAPFLEQYRLAWLYAPDDVIGHLKAVSDSLTINKEEESRMSEEQRQALQRQRDERGKSAIAMAVAAIRSDLFGTAGKCTELCATDFGHYS